MGSEASSQNADGASLRHTECGREEDGSYCRAERRSFPTAGSIALEPGAYTLGRWQEAPDPGSPVTRDSPVFHCHPSRASCTSKMLRVKVTFISPILCSEPPASQPSAFKSCRKTDGELSSMLRDHQKRLLQLISLPTPSSKKFIPEFNFPDAV